MQSARVRGVNATAYRSAMRCSGDLLSCAFRTSCTILAYWLSCARAVTSTVSGPSMFRLPLMSAVPGWAVMGTGSPVSRASSMWE